MHLLPHSSAPATITLLEAYLHVIILKDAMHMIATKFLKNFGYLMNTKDNVDSTAFVKTLYFTKDPVPDLD